MILAVSTVGIGTLAFSQIQESEPMIITTISGSVMDISLEMFGEHADFAIVGKVVKIKPVVYVDSERASDKKNNKELNIIIIDKEILSDVKIRVEEDLFGNYDKKFITLRVPGGETETQKTIHELSPQFVKGERVIVFVAKGDSYSISENNYTVLGLMQGTMRLIDDLDNSSDSSNYSSDISEKQQVISKFATDNMSEDSMKNIIKSLKNKD